MGCWRIPWRSRPAGTEADDSNYENEETGDLTTSAANGGSWAEPKPRAGRGVSTRSSLSRGADHELSILTAGTYGGGEL